MSAAFSPDVLKIPRVAVVVDPDDAMRARTAQAIRELGCQTVHEATDGKAAWDLIKAGDVDLIAMEWRLPELDGMALFNRLRRLEALAMVPVIVVSKLLHLRDFELLKEFPMARHLEAPLQGDQLENALFELLTEGVWYATSSAQVEKALADCAATPKAALTALQRLLVSSPAPIPLTLIASKHLIARKHHAVAEALLRHALKSAPRSAAVLWQLARVLYMRGEHAEARSHLATAERISPKNVERLCFAGQVSLTLGDGAHASQAFVKALAIDPGYRPAKAGQEVAAQLASFVAKRSGEALPQHLASVCNLLGVDLAQSGRADEAIQHYKAALVLIQDDPEAFRVTFNLGLAHLRCGDLEDAERAFERALRQGGPSFAKGGDYLRRVRIARSNAEAEDAFLTVERSFAEERVAAPAARDESLDDDTLEGDLEDLGAFADAV